MFYFTQIIRLGATSQCEQTLIIILQKDCKASRHSFLLIRLQNLSTGSRDQESSLRTSPLSENRGRVWVTCGTEALVIQTEPNSSLFFSNKEQLQFYQRMFCTGGILSQHHAGAPESDTNVCRSRQHAEVLDLKHLSEMIWTGEGMLLAEQFVLHKKTKVTLWVRSFHQRFHRMLGCMWS